MNDVLKRIREAIKSPKVMLVLGLSGILIIFLSSCFDSSKDRTDAPSVNEMSIEEYRAELEKQVLKIVEGISGDEGATVVLTLESGKRYSYLDSVSSDNSSSKAQSGGEQSSERMTRSFVTVKDSEGGEKALIITETMPKVRGVAIVCAAGEDEIIAEKIENAVMAALDITSKRVYIAGGSSYEKR